MYLLCQATRIAGLQPMPCHAAPNAPPACPPCAMQMGMNIGMWALQSQHLTRFPFTYKGTTYPAFTNQTVSMAYCTMSSSLDFDSSQWSRCNYAIAASKCVRWGGGGYRHGAQRSGAGAGWCECEWQR